MTVSIDHTKVTEHYVICALWSSTDHSYNADDLSPATLCAMAEDCKDFVDGNHNDLVKSGLSDSQIGHDFWLTRNGHGAGFWDRGLGALGDKLTKAAKVYGSCDLYVGDDGKLYL